MFFVTSDTHFGHTNIINYCNRPFSSVDEMNKKLIDNWNSVVSKNDTIIHLGDFCFYRKFDILQNLLNQLNGIKILVRGNHDLFLNEEYINAGFKEVYTLYNKSYLNYKWCFCHFQMAVWQHSHYGAFHLFGHEHVKTQPIPNHEIYKELKFSERKFNVCVDANNYKPINLSDIAKILIKRDINND